MIKSIQLLKFQIIANRYIITLVLLIGGILPIFSQSTYLLRSSLGNAGKSVILLSNGQEFTVQQSIGQGSVIGTFNQNGYVLRQGFIQPSKMAASPKASTKLQVTFSPNPASEKMTITLTETVNGPITVNLFDISGKTLFTDNFPVSQEIKLDYLPLACGIYIMEVTTGNQYFSAKLIKE
ncbi:MAG: T9SS type A sorting domain-containing protein [Salinivirgaceae bacterium]